MLRSCRRAAKHFEHIWLTWVRIVSVNENTEIAHDRGLSPKSRTTREQSLVAFAFPLDKLAVNLALDSHSIGRWNTARAPAASGENPFGQSKHLASEIGLVNRLGKKTAVRSSFHRFLVAAVASVDLYCLFNPSIRFWRCWPPTHSCRATDVGTMFAPIDRLRGRSPRVCIHYNNDSDNYQSVQNRPTLSFTLVVCYLLYITVLVYLSADRHPSRE